jgi:hypothetical protein
MLPATATVDRMSPLTRSGLPGGVAAGLFLVLMFDC